MKLNDLYNIKQMNKLIDTMHKYISVDAPKYQDKYPDIKGVVKDFDKLSNLNNHLKKDLSNNHYKNTSSLFEQLKLTREDSDVKLFCHGKFDKHFNFIDSIPRRISNKYINPLDSFNGLKYFIPRAENSVKRYHKYMLNRPSLETREQNTNAILDKQIPKQLTNLRKFTHQASHNYYSTLKKYISGVYPGKNSLDNNNIFSSTVKQMAHHFNDIQKLGVSLGKRNSKSISDNLDNLSTSIYNFYGSKPFNEVDKYEKKLSLNQELNHVKSVAQRKNITVTKFLKSWNSVRGNNAKVSYNPQTLVKGNDAKKSRIKISSALLDPLTSKASHRKVSYSKVPTQVYIDVHPRKSNLHNIIDLSKPNHSVWLNVKPGKFFEINKPIHTALNKLQHGQSLDDMKNVSVTKPTNVDPSLVKLSNNLTSEPIKQRNYKQYVSRTSKAITEKRQHLIDNCRRAADPITYGAPDDDFIPDPSYVKFDVDDVNKSVSKISAIKSGLKYAKSRQMNVSMSHGHIPQHHLHRSSDWQSVTKHNRHNNKRTVRRTNHKSISKKQKIAMKRKQNGVQRS